MINFVFVVVHAILWAFMEVEIEGKRGWMYDSPTQCAGFFGFTWYHIIMNILTIVTIVHINQYRQVLWTVYQILTWFIVEDVSWFIINGINYRTAPWQSATAAWISTFLPLILMVIVYRRVHRGDRFTQSTKWFVIPLLVQIVMIIFIWSASAKDFDANITYTPRNNYCSEGEQGE